MCAISIDDVNLKHRLRNIDPDRDNLTHGRLPSMWLRFDPTTLWHVDAAEWAPSTTSDSERLAVSTTSPEYPRKRKSSGRSATSESGHKRPPLREQSVAGTWSAV
jgi:hypothetical protein